jgi:ABC-type transporter Mla MlaB component
MNFQNFSENETLLIENELCHSSIPNLIKKITTTNIRKIECFNINKIDISGIQFLQSIKQHRQDIDIDLNFSVEINQLIQKSGYKF